MPGRLPLPLCTFRMAKAEGRPVQWRAAPSARFGFLSLEGAISVCPSLIHADAVSFDSEAQAGIVAKAKTAL